MLADFPLVDQRCANISIDAEEGDAIDFDRVYIATDNTTSVPIQSVQKL
jgi:hypothetical protein